MTKSCVPAIWIEADEQSLPALREAVVASGGTVAGRADEAEAIVWDAFDPPALRRALHPAIRWVQLSSAGIDDWLAEGIVDGTRVWTAAKGVHAGPIAEYVVGAILLFARRFPEVLALRRWQRVEPLQLRGTTVGVVGAGSIGEQILRMLQPFGARTVALTRSGRQVPGADESVGLPGLDDLLRGSDYLVLAAPETEKTRCLLDARRLALMQPGAVVVNVGRGSIVDTDALVDALRSGALRGAALDVTDPEPLPDGHPLWRMENVLISSHTAATAELSAPTFAARVRDNVTRYVAGKPLIGVVDVQAGY
jgi:phosphoglycerate dehydrogenase-like enzyme